MANQRNASQPAAALPWWRTLSRYQWSILAVGVLGWLFDGMDQRVFILARSPAIRELAPHASPAQVTTYAGYVTSIFILGWATGGLIFGIFGDRWGRARTMMVTILLYSLFTGLSAFSRTWWDFSLYRFLCGIGIGGEYAAGIALVAEVMPDRARPYCLGLLQGLGALGHVAGSFLSLILPPAGHILGLAGWKALFLAGALPALLVVIIRTRVREPETWLKAAAEAKASRGATGEKSKLGNIGEILRTRSLLFHAILGMSLGVVGQTGLWGIAYWSPELIRSSLAQERSERAPSTNLGRPADDAVVATATMLQDLGGLLGTFAITYVAAACGRRKALSLAYALSFGAAMVVFGLLRHESDIYWMIPALGFSLASIFGCFAIYFPELFPTRLRSTGVGLCYNGARYITALGPLALGQLTLFYAGRGFVTPLRPASMTLSIIFLAGIFLVRFAPETKGQTLPA